MKSDPDCLFCKIGRGEIRSEKVYEDEGILVFRDIQPQAPVHLLAIPKEHYAGIHEVPPSGMPVVNSLFLAIRTVVIEQGLAESGYRVVVNAGRDAGQEVPHLHAHILAGRKLSWPPG